MTGAIGPTGWPVPSESRLRRGSSAQTSQGMAGKGEAFYSKSGYSLSYPKDVQSFYLKVRMG